MNYDEILAIEAGNKTLHEPCFAFSVHKSGSTLLHSMLQAFCKRAGIAGISIPDVLFNRGLVDADWSGDPDLLEHFEEDVLYYGFRYLPDVMKLPRFNLRAQKFVLLVRDPRDALVSEYFSYGKKQGSHATPQDSSLSLQDRFAQADEESIDAYVRRTADSLLHKLTTYKDELNFSNGIVWRYEDIFFDKEKLLRGTLDHFGIDAEDRLVAQVAQRFDIRPEKEDETKHIRKGTPGDHVSKLTPETIEYLTDKFFDVGEFFGYDL